MKNLNILRLPRQGELIETTVTVIQEIFNVTLVSAEVRTGTEVIATTILKIAQEAAPTSPATEEEGKN